MLQNFVRASSRLKYLLFLFVIVFFLIANFSTYLITQALWFDAIDYFSIFTMVLTWKVALAIATFLLIVCFLYANFLLADFLTRNYRVQMQSQTIQFTRNMFRLLFLGLSIVIAYGWAGSVSNNWHMFAEFWHGSAGNLSDPIFGKDIGFYFFEYPFFRYIRRMLLTLILFSLAMSVAVYFAKGAIQFIQGWRNIFFGNIKTHITFLLIFLLLLVAWGFWLDRYQILYSSQGVFFGAGYTDVHARLAGFYLMTGVTLLGGILLFVSVFKKDIVLLAVSVAVIVVALVAVLGVYPWVQQKLIVEPNELEKEKPYIMHNIEFTRKAYAIDEVERHDYNIDENSSLRGISNITKNIRLWDWQPMLDTYRQIQEMRLYYRFHDVDPDRYLINGEYLQVMSAARELDYNRIPEQARTWVNTHLKYTHGYGLVMSPVDEVTEQGMPQLWIKDIPPVSSIDIQIDRPEIYYGELTSAYIFTGATTDEFDYPLGDTNSATRYHGKGGVLLDAFWKRLLYAVQFKTMKLLISEYITSQTKIHYHRTILERIKEVAPFLQYDNDPYLSVVDGRLLWIVDAYTASDRFPYAEPLANGRANYVRNSVKVTVDAYDGNINFYAVDQQDILLQTYAKIYPQLFKAEVPPQVRAHFRYPVDMFQIQSAMYLSYHMQDASVFYNREDLWRMSTEMYQGREQQMEPYYVIMPLPGQEKHEYLLIAPFTPVNKNNMIAWMTARSDGDNYGKLVVYEFPKKELVYGPMQIEARIDQDPQISELITLWSQKGSQVIRGNLIIIPYENNLLYVEPLYLRAEQAQMPELKRVILSYKNQIVISETLQESLSLLLKRPIGAALSKAIKEDQISLQELIERALQTFEASQQSLAQPNWEDYGKNQSHLKNILKNMQKMIKKDQEN